MTVTGERSATGGQRPAPGDDSVGRPPEELVAVTIDGIDVSVPKGTLVIRAAELLGIQIPRFCDHPLLEPVGACRQCIVEVEGQRKPVASCTIPVSDGMKIKTQLTSQIADKAQRGTLELLLINHPLDCPVCDKGGECPLQNQAMSNGNAESRFDAPKRTYPKPIPVSPQVLLDRERCVLCARCTRFSEQIAGDPFIEMFDRGAHQQVNIAPGVPFASYFSGNTIQICPVGALTSADYRFRSRPFDLVSTPATCEHCAAGCSLRVDHRRGRVLRRLAGDDPEVNEEWSCDKGRFGFAYARAADRLTGPGVRDRDTGELVAVSWSTALDVAARGLGEARDRHGAGALPGGRLTLEDAYAWAKFTRVVLRSNDVDARARLAAAPDDALAAGDEEQQFLAAAVAGRAPGAGGVSYASLEKAPLVVLVGLEPEEECPILFLRLRKAFRRTRLPVVALAPWRTGGLAKVGGRLLATDPGDEAALLHQLTQPHTGGASLCDEVREGLRRPGAVLLVGERLAAVPGALSAAMVLAATTGARLAWVPRRAGERGAVEAGALPGLLPGGRLVADAAARAEVGRLWGAPVPEARGRTTDAMLRAVLDGQLDGLLVGAVDPDDLTDPRLARQALAAAPFLVSCDIRPSGVTAVADVVLPVAAAQEKAGTFLDWEGRPRPFAQALDSDRMSDGRVVHLLAAELGVDLGVPHAAAAAAELAQLGRTPGAAAAPGVAARPPYRAGSGEAVLASWSELLDAGSLLAGADLLRATARAPRARLSAATAADVGVGEGEPLTVTGPAGAVTLPAQVTEMSDGVVWLPATASGSRLRTALGSVPGDVVRLDGAAAPVAPATPAVEEADAR
jgi:NADH-quinone oxidoreductase subunit G